MSNRTPLVFDRRYFRIGPIDTKSQIPNPKSAIGLSLPPNRSSLTTAFRNKIVVTNVIWVVFYY